VRQTEEEPVDRSIPFVDAHQHLWELNRLDYPWLVEPGIADQTEFLGDYAAIRTDWGPDRLGREFHGQRVSATVHVDAACLPRQAVAETAWLDLVAREHRFPNALVVFCDLRSPDAREVMEAHLAASAFTRGVRARPEVPAQAAFRDGLRHAAALGLSFELAQPPGRFREGLEVARLLADLQIIVGHAGFPQQRDPEYRDLWRREMRTLAAAPNVAVKISGLGMADHHWAIESIEPWVMDTLDLFGVERCMFGTNWPVDSLYSSYAEVVDAYRLLIRRAGMTRAEQHAVLHGNAERLYRIQPPSGIPLGEA
jgi:predicted TIM-barrel fold metal-dependent hydrolase